MKGFMIKYLLASISLLFVFSGCGINDTKELNASLIKSVSNTICTNKDMKYLFISMDGLTDPDDVGNITTALAMADNCEIEILGIDITGQDIYGKHSTIISAVLYYYGMEHIPIGESDRTDMRIGDALWVSDYPKLSSKYLGVAKTIDEFISDGCSNRLNRANKECAKRTTAIKMYCNGLDKIPAGKKANIVVIGHLYNIADLLNETTYCNGKELLEKKVEELVISSGWKDMYNHVPEQNFSSLNKDARKATVAATHYVFNNLPNNIHVTIANPAKSKLPKVGDLYQKYNINSPMAFAYSVDRYGYGIETGHKIGDALNIIYAVKGLNWYGTQYIKRKDCNFIIHSNGAVEVRGDRGNHHYVEPNISDYESFAGRMVSDLMKYEPKTLKKNNK